MYKTASYTTELHWLTNRRDFEEISIFMKFTGLIHVKSDKSLNMVYDILMCLNEEIRKIVK